MTEKDIKVPTLTTIQNELKAPKGQYNKFGKYNYRSAEDILEAVKPVLQAHGAELTISDKPMLIGDWHYVEASAELIIGTSTHTTTGYAREPKDKKGMDDSQITGTASSYARKYALNGLFLIDDAKDADSEVYGVSEQSQGNQQQNSQTPAQQVEARKAELLAMDAEIASKLNIQPGMPLVDAGKQIGISNVQEMWEALNLQQLGQMKQEMFKIHQKMTGGAMNDQQSNSNGTFNQGR